MTKLILAALLPVITVSLAGEEVSKAKWEPPKSDTVEFNFNPGWLVAQGSYPVEGTDDTGWERVSTPHTYHERIAYQGLKAYERGCQIKASDARKKGGNSGKTPYPPDVKGLGPFTYRKHFSVPGSHAGNRLILEFQGIRQRGQIYLNGHLLGRHSNGVTPFGFDITPSVNLGGENILHIEIDCDNKEFDTGTVMQWFEPGLNALYGGIPRNVILHAVPTIHATLPLSSFLGTSGTYVYAENISTEKRTADIGVEVQVGNDGEKPGNAECRAVVIDREGRAVISFEPQKQEVLPGKPHTFKFAKNVGDLSFWQLGHPYLYDLYTIVKGGDGTTDVRKIETGFRKIEVREAALFLNNRLLMTMGNTQRSQNEWPAVGNAYPDWMHDYSNAMRVEGNSRLVRWEHIMPSPQDVASCDRVGLPQIMPGADRECDMVGREWELRLEVTRNAIISCRNSPSVLLWEAGNNNLSIEHIGQMINLRNQWDPRGYRRPMGGRSEGPEWRSSMFGVRTERYCLSIDTEYLRDESPRRWWDSYSPPYFHTAGDFAYVDNNGGWNRNQDNFCVMQSMVYEKYYNKRPPRTGEGGICNGGAQIFFAESDTFKRGDDVFRRSGVVDGMRIPKDAFGCNKTMWSNTPELWTDGHPAVYIPGHWNYPPGTVKPIYVFISPGVERVSLAVNGKDVGECRRTNQFLFTCGKVAWEPGVIKATGFDRNGKAIADMSHETIGDAAALKVSVIQSPSGLRADGSDMVIIQTEVCDAQGRRCPLVQNLIHYDMSGPAVWRGGLWDEDVLKYANTTELPVLNGVHRVIVRSTESPGTIKVSATTDGLKPVSVSIDARKVAIEKGLTKEMPVTAPVVLKEKPVYGPDLGPAPVPPPGAFNPLEGSVSFKSESVYYLTVAFAAGAELVHKAANGSQVYKDKDWVFKDLPEYLQGADYLKVANADARASAAEGVVFTMGRIGRVYVAYDDANPKFPEVSSPTTFEKTTDTITIGGRPHTLYRTKVLRCADTIYLGTNSWMDQAPAGVNNYVIFLVVRTDDNYREFDKNNKR